MTATALVSYGNGVEEVRTRIIPSVMDGMTLDTVHAEVCIVYRKCVKPHEIRVHVVVADEAFMTLPTVGISQGILHVVRLVEIAAQPHQRVLGRQGFHLGSSDEPHASVAVDTAKGPRFVSFADRGRTVKSGHGVYGPGIETPANSFVKHGAGGKVTGVAEIIVGLDDVARDPAGRTRNHDHYDRNRKPESGSPTALLHSSICLQVPRTTNRVRTTLARIPALSVAQSR